MALDAWIAALLLLALLYDTRVFVALLLILLLLIVTGVLSFGAGGHALSGR